MSAAPEPIEDFGRRLLAGELAEELLDVLDFKRAGVQRVLLDQVFQRVSAPRSIADCERLFHRTVERFTRKDEANMQYDVLIDDPGAYTKPWKSGFARMYRWGPTFRAAWIRA